MEGLLYLLLWLKSVLCIILSNLFKYGMIWKNGCDNMTIKLYDKDAYLTIFEAQVITCTKRENDYDIVLDQTLFFPE